MARNLGLSLTSRATIFSSPPTYVHTYNIQGETTASNLTSLLLSSIYRDLYWRRSNCQNLCHIFNPRYAHSEGYGVLGLFLDFALQAMRQLYKLYQQLQYRLHMAMTWPHPSLAIHTTCLCSHLLHFSTCFNTIQKNRQKTCTISIFYNIS